MKRLRFIILAHERTGHWVIARALDEHPNITYVPYEPLSHYWPLIHTNPAEKVWFEERNRSLYEIYGEESKNWDAERWRNTDVSQFIAEFWKHYNGFKISPYHLATDSPTWEYLRNLDDLKIIFLVRHNKIEQYVSDVLAKTTKIWHVVVDDPGLKSKLDNIKIEIDTEQMVDYINCWRMREAKIIERFNDPRMLRVAYEEIRTNFSATTKKIQEFLGVECFSFKPAYQKSNTIPLEERVTNHKEVKTYEEKPCKKNEHLDKCVCTVMSNGYYAKSLCTIQCMLRFVDADGYIFISDSVTNPQIEGEIEKLGIRVINFSEVQKDDILAKKVQYANHDSRRWAAKPGCINYLLNRGYKRVIYADNDCHFIDNFDFLFDYLLDYGILLTPHWKSIHPLKDATNEKEFGGLFRTGIFNAGFIGVSQKGREFLDFWREACAWKCEIDASEGLYVDQKYIDAVPAMFPDICKITHHRGCNVASWNKSMNERVMQEDGGVLINNKWPIIFFHFSWTCQEHWLKPYLNQYKEEVEKWGKWIGIRKTSNVLLDCGSNKLQGLNELIKSHHINNSWVIHAFEPNPFLEKFILKEIQHQDVTYHKVAVGSSDKIVSFGYNSRNDEFANTCEWFPRKNFRDVLQIDFAKFIADNFHPSNNIICKMDIEGSEYPVLLHLIQTGVIDYFNKLYVEWHVDNQWGHDWPKWANEKIRNRCREIRREIEKFPQYEEWTL